MGVSLVGIKNGSCEPLKSEGADVCSQFCVSANRLAIDQYLGDSLYRFTNNFTKFFLVDTSSGDVDVLIITVAMSFSLLRQLDHTFASMNSYLVRR